MKKIEEMTQEEKELLTEVLGYTNASGTEVNNIKYFMHNYIDAKAHICGHCKAQIRFMFKRVVNWAERNKVAIFQEEVQEETRTCKSCDNDISHLDGRTKYCNDKCKIAYKNK